MKWIVKKSEIQKLKTKRVLNDLRAKSKTKLSRNDIMKHWVPNGSCCCIDNQEDKTAIIEVLKMLP